MYNQAENQAINEILSTTRQTFSPEQPILGEIARPQQSSYKLPELFISDHISDSVSAQTSKVDNSDFLFAQELISDLVPPRRYRS